MAKHCTHCGKELPRDDAQFCSNCGMLVSSESSRPQVLAENSGNPETTQTPVTPIPEVHGEKHALREQIAQQPINRSSAKSQDYPVSMSGLEQEISSPSLSQYPPLPPTSGARTSSPRESTVPRSRPPLRRPVAQPDSSTARPSPEKPLSPLTPDSVAPVRHPSASIQPPTARELRVKVWEADEAQDQPEAPSAKQSESGDAPPSPGEEPSSVPRAAEPQPAIEDLPTEDMPSAPIAESVLTRRRVPKRPDPRNYSISEPVISSIEDVPTRNMPLTPSQRDVLSDMPGRNVAPSSAHIEELARVDTLMLPNGAVDTPPVPLFSPALPASPASSAPASRIPVTPSSPRAKSRRSSLLALLLVIVVLLVAAGVWVFVARPFSVAEVTQPWQQFTDSDPSVAISMLYPAGWPAGSHSNGAVSLHDSSNTAMVTVSTMAATASDPIHALQQQATKLGMTGVKALAPLSFAGVNWQREQGSVQMNGATYTIILLTGVHSKHLYTLGQLAAQNVYADYEQTIFAPMRASLRFL